MIPPTFESCSHCHFPDIDSLETSHEVTVSPIPDVLSNYWALPSNSQVDAVNTHLRDLDKNIKHWKQHIDNITPLLQKLEMDRRSLERHRDKYHSLLAPIRRLHPEILAKIFLLYPRGVERRDLLPEVLDIRNPFTGPLLLSHVCRSWRVLAFETPSLWTTIRITVDVNKPSQNEITKLCLSLSKDLPLSVGLLDSRKHPDYPPYISSDPPAYYRNPTLKDVLDQSQRWEELYTSLPPFAGDWAALSRIKDNLDSLQYLSLDFSMCPSKMGARCVIDYFENLPRIRQLFIHYDICVHTLEPRLCRLSFKFPSDITHSLSQKSFGEYNYHLRKLSDGWLVQ